jgi:RimJ/RimL family protein N-acetyltransferase
MNWPEVASVTLANTRVELRPIVPDDRESLRAQAMSSEIWRYFVLLIETDADFDAFFDAALADQAAGDRVVYLIRDLDTAEAAGSMSFCGFAEAAGRVEIGWSWLGTRFQGRGVNRWAKFLMLEHAFGPMAAERVEFKTDALNQRARKGLRNIGATEEGTLRSFNPMPGGRRRNAVYYSVLRQEWPAVRARLLAGPRATPPGSAS